MPHGRTVLLDGTAAGDGDLAPLVQVVEDELRRAGAEAQVYRLRDIELGNCIGCFGCWLETPGVCVESDAGRDITRDIARSDTVVLLSPVTFGGYSSEIKKTQDRWIPLILPHFGIVRGEVHHLPRYATYPRWIGIGVQRQPDAEAAGRFEVLVGRNAINFHAPSFAAEVLTSTESPAQWREQLRDALERHDAFPTAEVAASVMPSPVDAEPAAVRGSPGRALLIVGSPKAKSPSTSGVLGGYVLAQLARRGWETETLTLRRSVLREKGQAELLAAVARADLVVLAFPLYIDALPFLLTKALEVIAGSPTADPAAQPKRLFAIANNGFPEAHHNALALAICRRFAADAGMTWSGCLAMGAGEALFRGQPFEAEKRNAPPVTHVARALDLASAALADGRAVPPEAVELIAKTPIRVFPFRLWRWVMMKLGNRHWRQLAAANDVSARALFARPYEADEGARAPDRLLGEACDTGAADRRRSG